MAEEDIYGSKRRYERIAQNFDELLVPPEKSLQRGRRRYFCRNRENLGYFTELHRIFERLDLSYVARLRRLHVFLFATWASRIDLATCEREQIDEIVARAHKVNVAPRSKECFIKNLKWIWAQLFPERDERGRIQDSVPPYPVRHLSARVDKSRQRLRNDRLTFHEYERLVGYFNGDSEMQAYITLAVESLGRPQEICYTLIRDVELRDDHAKVWVSSHGKEGTKFLQCIDSYPYLAKWYSQHPHQSDNEAFLFLAGGRRDRQLTPANINKKLRTACRRLGIEKRITAYSLKRNGVTFRRLRGDADVDIQHAAGWTSTKQLQTYDLSTAEDVFQNQLARRGLASEKTSGADHSLKHCVCGAQVAFTQKVCERCKRIVGSDQVAKDAKADREIREVFAMALDQPNRSFAEIIDEYRRKKSADDGEARTPRA